MVFVVELCEPCGCSAATSSGSKDWFTRGKRSVSTPWTIWLPEPLLLLRLAPIQAAASRSAARPPAPARPACSRVDPAIRRFQTNSACCVGWAMPGGSTATAGQ